MYFCVSSLMIFPSVLSSAHMARILIDLDADVSTAPEDAVLSAETASAAEEEDAADVSSAALSADDEEDDTAITFNDSNTGIIKYTSRGLYSIDLRLSDKVVDVRENVSLMPFDQIAENLPAQLEGQLDLDKLGNPSTLNISDIQLCYYSNLSKEETIKMASASDSENYNKSYQSVPTWMIELVSTTEGNLFAYATVNAIDGTLINIEYYDVSEVD